MSPTLAHRHAAPAEWTGARVRALMDTAAALDASQRHGRFWQPLRGRQVALLCAAPGPAEQVLCRAVAAAGGSVAQLPTAAWHTGDARSLPEAARMLGRLYDAIDCCDLPAALVEKIERHAGVPVFDGLACEAQPLRVLADLLAMREASGQPLAQLRLRIEGDAAAAPVRAAAAIARSAGVQVQQGTGAAAEKPHFALDPTAAPADSGRLTAPGAPPAEQARLAARRARLLPFVLQAVIVEALG